MQHWHAGHKDTCAVLKKKLANSMVLVLRAGEGEGEVELATAQATVQARADAGMKNAEKCATLYCPAQQSAGPWR
jgi:hypothetical protein